MSTRGRSPNKTSFNNTILLFLIMITINIILTVTTKAIATTMQREIIFCWTL